MPPRLKKRPPPKTRDYLMVAVINGTTKAGVHIDRKKKADKLKCRGTNRPSKEDAE